MKSGEKVAIVKCKSYEQKEVDKAVRKLIDLLDFPASKYKNKKVLIKPNIVGYFAKNLDSIITNPSIAKALMKIFKGSIVGESSASDTENNMRKSGYWKLKPIIFEEHKLIRIKNEKNKILKYFRLPESVKNADLIINAPKLKTHTLVQISCAIKNLFGCIPGGIKQVYHMKAKGEKNFSNLLVDIFQNIKPGLNIMDAVVSMEGEGPTAGNPRKTNFLLASKNAVALDIACARLMGFNPEKIFTISEAVKRGLGDYKIQIIGDVKEIPNLKFKKAAISKREMMSTLLSRMTKEKITADRSKCIKCGLCARKCPGKAISLKPYPVINTKKCIRCFCCIELCPQHAMHLQENIVRTAIRKIRGKIRKKRYK